MYNSLAYTKSHSHIFHKSGKCGLYFWTGPGKKQQQQEQQHDHHHHPGILLLKKKKKEGKN